MYLECYFVPNLAELNTLYVMYMECYFVPNLAEIKHIICNVFGMLFCS